MDSAVAVDRFSADLPGEERFNMPLQIPYRRQRLAVAALDTVLAGVAALERLVGLDALGLPRRRFVAPPKRILLLRLERIGDLLMTLDAIAAVRRLAPEAEIDLVVGSWNESLARLIAGVTRVRTLDAPWLAREGEGLQLAALVRHAGEQWAPRNYDIAINFEGDVRSHVLMARSRAPVRVGFDMAGGGPLLSHRVSFDPARHTAWNALRIVETAAPLLAGRDATGEVPAEPARRPTLAPPEPHLERVRERLRDPALDSRPLIGLNAGGGRAVKQWPPERFGAAVGRLAAETGAVVVLTGAAGDRALVEAARAAVPAHVPVVDLVGEADLVLLAAWLSRCRIVVTGDTGPMHLAAAVGTPVVAVFGPSDERRYAPLVEPHRIVARRADLPCAPCNQIRLPPAHCRDVTPACLEGVAPETLYEAARQLWAETGMGRGALASGGA
jgi:ADP-heptose:LPS heptosyltransferase